MSAGVLPLRVGSKSTVSSATGQGQLPRRRPRRTEGQLVVLTEMHVSCLPKSGMRIATGSRELEARKRNAGFLSGSRELASKP